MNFRKYVPLIAALALVALTVSPVAAAGHLTGGELDFSADLGTALVGVLAGITASIAAVFAVAALIKVGRKAAGAALRALGMIK